MPPSTPALPITPLLPKVLAAARLGPVVVSAATGSGKSTCVPPALTALGRVLVVEPRRVACRALAMRVAELRGSPPGTDVGWIVRDERRVADNAAVTFVTPGVALRIVQSGDIDQYGAVVLDEFHERAFDTDLLLCLLQERKQRGLVVMSATVQGERVANHLGGVHLVGEGRTFPITTRYLAGESAMPTKKGIEERVVHALATCVNDPGDVLVFLPGKMEIARVGQAIDRSKWDVFPLHGDMTLREQGDVLSPRGAARRRVILATNVAETSLTIPGIGVVIDSGLVRGMLYRAGRGYLSLLPIARDSAEQRAGRAGRTGPGVCIRLWAQSAQLDDVTLPEIHRGSLVSLTLSALACSPKGMDLPWLDRPKSFAVTAAMNELSALGCIKDGVITEAGLRLFALPLDVALARLLVAGASTPGLAEPTLLLAAALSADRSLFRKAEHPYGRVHGAEDLRASGCDAVALIEAVRRGDAARDELDPKALGEARAAADRFRKLGFGEPRWSGTVPRRALAELLIHIWPGSAHVRRDQKKRRFSWAAGGTEMELDPDSAVRPADSEAIVVLDSRAVAAQGMSSGLLITAAMPVPLAWLTSAGLGQDEIGPPDINGRTITVTVSRVYAGQVLSTREEEPRGSAARTAVRDLILAGRCMKGALGPLRERYDLAGLAVQVALTSRDTRSGLSPLAPLPEWLLTRLEDLGLESGADLQLLNHEDIMPALPPDDMLALIARQYPRKLDVGDAKYQIEYVLADKSAIFHQVSGTRREAPSAMHLPNLAGLRLFWEHKNRVLPISR